MIKYPKIQTIYRRWLEKGPDCGKLIKGSWTNNTFYVLRNAPWSASEKIDGTNIRVVWNSDSKIVKHWARKSHKIDYPKLLEYLRSTFTPERFIEAGMDSMTLYGEGYGTGIQAAGKLYNPDGVSFILFDVLVPGHTELGLWLRPVNVKQVAEALGIQSVPSLGVLSLYEASELAATGFDSAIGTAKAEGIVLRAPCGLLSRRGARIITKIKTSDFTRGFAPNILEEGTSDE